MKDVLTVAEAEAAIAAYDEEIQKANLEREEAEGRARALRSLVYTKVEERRHAKPKARGGAALREGSVYARLVAALTRL